MPQLPTSGGGQIVFRAEVYCHRKRKVVDIFLAWQSQNLAPGLRVLVILSTEIDVFQRGLACVFVDLVICTSADGALQLDALTRLHVLTGVAGDIVGRGNLNHLSPLHILPTRAIGVFAFKSRQSLCGQADHAATQRGRGLGKQLGFRFNFGLVNASHFDTATAGVEGDQIALHDGLGFGADDVGSQHNTQTGLESGGLENAFEYFFRDKTL